MSDEVTLKIRDAFRAGHVSDSDLLEVLNVHVFELGKRLASGGAEAKHWKEEAESIRDNRDKILAQQEITLKSMHESLARAYAGQRELQKKSEHDLAQAERWCKTARELEDELINRNGRIKTLEDTVKSFTSGKNYVCAYCGMDSPWGEDAAVEHAKTCQEHPAWKQVKSLEEELRGDRTDRYKRAIEVADQTDRFVALLKEGKYTRWAADYSIDQLAAVLWLVGEFGMRDYGADARKVDGFGPAERRHAAALNALCHVVRNAPYSREEVRSLMRKAADDNLPEQPTERERVEREEVSPYMDWCPFGEHQKPHPEHCVCGGNVKHVTWKEWHENQAERTVLLEQRLEEAKKDLRALTNDPTTASIERAADELDLLRKFADGVGGRRTGKLIKQGYIKVEVTAAGYRALGREVPAGVEKPACDDCREPLGTLYYSGVPTSAGKKNLCPGCLALRTDPIDEGWRCSNKCYMQGCTYRCTFQNRGHVMDEPPARCRCVAHVAAEAP